MQGNRLYVGNLSYSVTEEQLKEQFAAHGEVTNITVITGKGFGFVEFSSSDMAEAAKEAMDGTELDGRTLKVDEARPPRERNDRGRGGDRNRGGGGGGRY
ncbi:MAG: RNA-binding protein [FCB group bacterium]|nr:RNA-binding protein [FCB group bacterium]